jgi:NitT/TauT family transport system substrate-binding protein
MPKTTPAKLDRHSWSRRRFLKMAGGLGLSAAGVALPNACGINPGQSATGGAVKLETTTIRIPWGNPRSICVAPALVAEMLLKAEGFTDIQYIRPATPALAINCLATATGDIGLYFSAPNPVYVDDDKPITMLAGVHIGCFELSDSDQINQISDLKGKTLAVSQLGGDKVFMASILANVGLDPNTDVTWLNLPPNQTKQLFIDGQIEAILAFPPTRKSRRPGRSAMLCSTAYTTRRGLVTTAAW